MSHRLVSLAEHEDLGGADSTHPTLHRTGHGSLSDRDHQAFQEEMRDFAETEIRPVARALDDQVGVPLGERPGHGGEGVVGNSHSPGVRGDGKGLSQLRSGRGGVGTCGCEPLHHRFGPHARWGLPPSSTSGRRSRREKWVPLLAKGRVLGGFGLTEPGAGSDASSTRTRAVREGEGWRINGSKIFITHAGVGEIFVVTAVTEPGRGSKGITSFIVCKPTVDLDRAEALGVGHAPELEFISGVRAGKKEDKLGWRASDTRELLLEDAFVPDENQLGEEGRGFINFMKTLDAGRVGVAALSLGLAEGAFEEALKYTQEREQFGRKIWDFQAVQFRLADLATEIQAGRHLTYHAAWLQDQGRPFGKEAAMAKLYCSELCMRATTQAVQLLGGVGYTQDYPVERMMRDAKVCEIGEGTSEIQKIVIGRHLVREAFGN